MTLKKILIALIFFFTVTKTFSQNDCSDAIIVCGNTGFEGLSATGIGVQELGFGNNCDSEENNSIWLKLSINTGGTLGFILTPENTNIGVDFDFFIFGPNVSCGNLGQAIRCSTTNPEAANATDNLTGLRDEETDTSEGPGPRGNSFVQSLTVNNGESYFLVIDRPSGFGNFSLTWTGTATFNQPPTFQIPAGTALDLKSCDTDGVLDNLTPFNLDQNTIPIIGSQTSVAVTYHISANDVLTGENPITPSGSFRNTTNPQTIFARITDTVTGCFSTSEFSIEAISVLIPVDKFATCDDNLDGDDQNGQATFNMNDVTAGILPGINTTGFVIDYFSTLGNATTNTNAYGATHYNTTPNEESVFVKVTNPQGCISIKEIKLIVNPLPAKASGTLVQCDSGLTPDGLTLFNLNEAIPSLTGNDTNLRVEFFQTGSAVPLPIAYNNISNPQILDVKITNLTTGCSSWGTLDLNVNVINRIVTIAPQCDEAETGIMPFDLGTTNIVLTPTETARFYSNLNDALLEQNEITNTGSYPNATPYNATIYVRVEDANSCSGISPIELVVNRLPQIKTQGTGYVCSNLPNRYITLDAGLLQGNPNDFTYEWSTTTPIRTSPTIQVNETGTYTVKVTNIKGCSKTRTIEVVLSNNATISDIVIVDLVQNNTVTVLLDAASIGSYQYSLDLPNGPFQDSNYFENVVPGVHMVYVYDTHGCGTVSKKISVLKIPAFFTPNADGTNDTWDIIGISPNFFASSKIYIFDRFGKLLADVDPKGAGWDGNYNGYPLPANDYWYLVKLETGRTIRGHFSLLR